MYTFLVSGLPPFFFLNRIFVFFLNSSREVLRQYPTTSDGGVLPNPSHYIVYKNLAIQLYWPKTVAVQRNDDINIVL